MLTIPFIYMGPEMTIIITTTTTTSNSSSQIIQLLLLWISDLDAKQWEAIWSTTMFPP
jgi:hypothetical protein